MSPLPVGFFSLSPQGYSYTISAMCINGIIKTKIWYNRNNQYGLDSGNMDMTAGANKSGYPMS
ncbi:hypothetical protein I3700191H1_08580 [Megasphaera massiliensis]